MIQVPRRRAPANFKQDCRDRGTAWLLANPAAMSGFPNYWRQFIPELCAAFNNRCGYLAMWDLNGTVDHFRPSSDPANRDRIYRWGNYRYATGWFNSSKKALAKPILDPFTVRDEWFEIDLSSLHLKLTAAVPPQRLARARFTIQKLRLDYRRRLINQRKTYLDLYRNGQIPISTLELEAPMLAVAIWREMLLKHLQANPPVSVAQAAAVCNMPAAKIRPLLRAWRLAGHIKSQGRGSALRYRL